MSVMVENTQMPDFNQQLLFHNPKEVTDVSGFLWVVIKDKTKGADSTIGAIKIELDSLKPYIPIHFSTKLPVKPEEMVD